MIGPIYGLRLSVRDVDGAALAAHELMDARLGWFDPVMVPMLAGGERGRGNPLCWRRAPA